MRLLNLFAVFLCLSGFHSTAYSSDHILLLIGGIKNQWTYEIETNKQKISLVSSVPIHRESSHYFDLLNERNNSLKNRRDNLINNKNEPVGVSWLAYSPDCKEVVYGYEDKRGNTVGISYGLLHTQEKKVLTAKDTIILDMTWSQDSRYLIVLEGRDKLSKNFSSLIRSLFGHGDPLVTFYISVIDIATGKSHKQEVLSDVPQGIGVIRGAKGQCNIKDGIKGARLN